MNSVKTPARRFIRVISIGAIVVTCVSFLLAAVHCYRWATGVRALRGMHFQADQGRIPDAVRSRIGNFPLPFVDDVVVIDTQGRADDATVANLRAFSTLYDLDLEDSPVHRPELSAFPQLEFLDLDSTLVDDTSLSELRGLHQLQELDLSYTPIEGSGLACLAELENLHSLWIEASHFNGTGLGALENLPNLNHLSLAESNVGDAGLAEVAKLRQLQTLSLLDTCVTDEGLAELHTLQNLETIDLSRGRIVQFLPVYAHPSTKHMLRPFHNDPQLVINGKGLKHLASLPNLRNLSLVGCQLTDEGFASLGQLKQLEWLDLDFTGLTDSSVRHLSGLINLKHLSLNGARITDAGLKHLKPLAALENLNAGGSEASDGGWNELRSALPHLRIPHLEVFMGE